MTPIDAIEGLPELLKRLTAIQSHLAAEADELAELWAGIGNAGGQRDDHAAVLLSRLRPHLAALATFAKTCERQIDGFVADPFGTRQSADAAAPLAGEETFAAAEAPEPFPFENQ